MVYFGPVMSENHFDIVCRNTPHLYEFCYREERAMKDQTIIRWAGRAGSVLGWVTGLTGPIVLVALVIWLVR